MGRKKGTPKTGGRKKGTPNRATKERQAMIEASGLTPLEFMLDLMRDTKAPQEARLDAAKAAAPYVHPKLNSIELSGDPDRPLVTEIRETIIEPNPQH